MIEAQAEVLKRGVACKAPLKLAFGMRDTSNQHGGLYFLPFSEIYRVPDARSQQLSLSCGAVESREVLDIKECPIVKISARAYPSSDLVIVPNDHVLFTRSTIGKRT